MVVLLRVGLGTLLRGILLVGLRGVLLVLVLLLVLILLLETLDCGAGRADETRDTLCRSGSSR